MMQTYIVYTPLVYVCANVLSASIRRYVTKHFLLHQCPQCPPRLSLCNLSCVVFKNAAIGLTMRWLSIPLIGVLNYTWDSIYANCIKRKKISH